MKRVAEQEEIARMREHNALLDGHRQNGRAEEEQDRIDPSHHRSRPDVSCDGHGMGRIRDVVEVRGSEQPLHTGARESIEPIASSIRKRRGLAPREGAARPRRSPMLWIRASIVPATAELRAVATY